MLGKPQVKPQVKCHFLTLDNDFYFIYSLLIIGQCRSDRKGSVGVR